MKCVFIFKEKYNNKNRRLIPTEEMGKVESALFFCFSSTQTGAKCNVLCVCVCVCVFGRWISPFSDDQVCFC